MNEKTVTFRVDEHIKNAFERIAQEKDLTTSQMLRHFMRNVVDESMSKNAQKGLFETTKSENNNKTNAKQKSVIPKEWRAK